MKINWYPSSYQRKKITNCTEEKNVYLIITLSAFSLYLSALCFPLTIPRCFSHTFTRIAWPNLQAYRSLQKFSSFLLAILIFITLLFPPSSHSFLSSHSSPFLLLHPILPLPSAVSLHSLSSELRVTHLIPGTSCTLPCRGHSYPLIKVVNRKYSNNLFTIENSTYGAGKAVGR